MMRRRQTMKDRQEPEIFRQQDEDPKDTKDFEEAKKRPDDQAHEDPQKTKEWEDDKE
jgi:hypothetical protein